MAGIELAYAPLHESEKMLLTSAGVDSGELPQQLVIVTSQLD